MSVTPVRVLATPDETGIHVAGRLLERIKSARDRRKRFLLGCPTGRTPRPLVAALARRLHETKQDIAHLVLVMMDEYLVEGPRGLEYAPGGETWSSQNFARVEIAARLNAGLPTRWQLKAQSVWLPDPLAPEAYEKRIADAGGIDFFILASGARDGHVAFNQPGSARDSRTRIIPLADETRRDNLATFPAFGAIENVPRHGVSVGIATIAEAREAAMIVWGTGKHETLKRMVRAERYEPEWPATVIHECATREIVSDADAAAGLKL